MIILRLYKYITKHVHKWLSIFTQEPTCTEGGYTNYKCSSCGRTYTHYESALGHDYPDSWTCVDGTQHKRICAKCSAEEKANHTYGGWELDMSEHWRTCTAEGCGYQVRGTHSVEYTTTKEPTCTEKGLKEGYCSVCGGYAGDEEIDELGHAWGNWADVDGNNHGRSCSRCGHSETDAHAYIGWENSDTEHWQECYVCGYEKGREAHNYPSWEAVDSAVCKATCTTCGYTETSAHEFSVWHDHSDSQHVRLCSKIGCTAAEYESHTYGDWEDYDEDLHARYCTVCNHMQTGIHAFGDWMVAPGQEGLAVKEYRRICSTCGRIETKYE